MNDLETIRVVTTVRHQQEEMEWAQKNSHYLYEIPSEFLIHHPQGIISPRSVGANHGDILVETFWVNFTFDTFEICLCTASLKMKIDQTCFS